MRFVRPMISVLLGAWLGLGVAAGCAGTDGDDRRDDAPGTTDAPVTADVPTSTDGDDRGDAPEGGDSAGTSTSDPPTFDPAPPPTGFRSEPLEPVDPGKRPGASFPKDPETCVPVPGVVACLDENSAGR